MNQCGECTECCHSLNVRPEDGVKYEWGSSCEKVCATGCSIHDNKPDVCKRFLCAYRQHNLDEQYRPDRYGMAAEFVGDAVIFWPNRHGQKNINPEEWDDDNKEKILDLMDEVMFSLKQYIDTYHIQTFNGNINKKTYK
jgi:Fe-S-cluster containining protein